MSCAQAVGLENPGTNRCYFNAVLQCLEHCGLSTLNPPSHSASCPDEDGQHDPHCHGCALETILSDMEPSADALSPQRVVDSGPFVELVSALCLFVIF